jgi:hypothetical protein
MKKFLIVLLAIGLALGASAQRGGHGGGHYYGGGRSRVIVSTGVYAPFGYGYYGYPLYPYSYGYPERPTRLELRVEDIRNDYRDRIWSARHDKSISRKERKATIHRLKHERDQAIIDVRRNYYKTR